MLALIASAATPSRHLKAVKAPKPVVVDGDLTKDAWKAAPQATGFTDYVNGTLVDDQTIVSVLYDDQFIYIAFDCRDAQPNAVTARETVRDSKFLNSNNGPSNTEDNVEVDLDPFFTKSYGDLSRFSVNAIGTRSAAIAGGRGSKGDWDAVSKRTATGWTCEMRIPWASFHYPKASQPTNLGINFTRYITAPESFKSGVPPAPRDSWIAKVFGKASICPKRRSTPSCLCSLTR
jgi:hypothetical protein